MSFELTRRHLQTALDELAARDHHIAAGLELVGYPPERRSGKPGYETLLRTIVGQQLSIKAAATIYGRLEAAMRNEIRPQRLLRLADEALRATGLSRQKIAYARGLSEAVADGGLDPEALVQLPDDEVIAELTRVKGIGRWSAEMFLLFSLGRPDVWPADDLGIQAGVGRLKRMRSRPDRNKTERIARPWRPYRGAAAIFVWHFYSNAPID